MRPTCTAVAADSAGLPGAGPLLLHLSTAGLYVIVRTSPTAYSVPCLQQRYGRQRLHAALYSRIFDPFEEFLALFGYADPHLDLV